jgi:hypothetical protein
MKAMERDMVAGARASSEFRMLERAVRKAGGDRERALRLAAREMGLNVASLPLPVVGLIDRLLAAEVRP